LHLAHDTEVNTLVPLPVFGVGTIVQRVPSQRCANIFHSLPMCWVPTFMQKVVVGQETLTSTPAPTGFGFDTRRNDRPFQRSINVRLPTLDE
jgi:hypothetical protein